MSIDDKESDIFQEMSSASSCWDLIHERSISPVIVYLLSKVFWPDFVEKEGLIFIAENFDDEYFNRLKEEMDFEKIEGTINTTYLDNILNEESDTYDGRVLEELGSILCQTWVARAKSLFPDHEFKAEFHWYSEDGDPGIVIEQVRS